MGEKIKHQIAIIEKYLKNQGNQLCADCKRPSPTWASINLGIFVCIKCSGCHRELGTHISKVRSINLDTWPAKTLNMFGKITNEYWEHDLRDYNFEVIRNNDFRLQDFIRDKYDRKRYINSRVKDPVTLIMEGHDLVKEYSLRGDTIEEKVEEKEVKKKVYFKPKGKSFGIVSNKKTPQKTNLEPQAQPEPKIEEVKEEKEKKNNDSQIITSQPHETMLLDFGINENNKDNNSDIINQQEKPSLINFDNIDSNNNNNTNNQVQVNTNTVNTKSKFTFIKKKYVEKTPQPSQPQNIQLIPDLLFFSKENSQRIQSQSTSKTPKAKGFGFIHKHGQKNNQNTTQSTQTPITPQNDSNSNNNNMNTGFQVPQLESFIPQSSDTLLDLYSVESEPNETVKKLSDNLLKAYSTAPTQEVEPKLQTNPNNYNVLNMNYPNININNYYNSNLYNNMGYNPYGYAYSNSNAYFPQMQKPLINQSLLIELYNDPNKKNNIEVENKRIYGFELGYVGEKKKKKDDDPFKSLVNFQK